MAGRLATVDSADELERACREEATRIRAALAARVGDVGLAEEAVRDAFVEALEHWRAEGVPPNPGGWLATTARRKAIDRLRRERAGQEKLALLAAIQPPGPGWVGGAGEVPGPGVEAGPREADESLGLIFACCHPLLSRESQITLTLRVVCSLTTAEIAAAFLAGEPAMAQRLSRARKALRETGPDQLGGRPDEVLAVIYLLFNEGYLASAGRTPARRDLAARAVALNRLMPREPEVLGLLALLLHESRAATRFDGWGRLVRFARPGPYAVGPGADRRGHQAARPGDDPGPPGPLPAPGRHRRDPCGCAQLPAHQLAADPGIVRPALPVHAVAGSCGSTGRSRPGTRSARRPPWPRSTLSPPTSAPTGYFTPSGPSC
jgi:DNA-directed RNA polymerase specialized sigma24 family protein